MISITFNAFLSLQSELSRRNIDASNSRFDLAEGSSPEDLMGVLGLEQRDVEAVFVNGKVVPADSVLRDGDRVAFVPPGLPGPHRYLLGLREVDGPQDSPSEEQGLGPRGMDR